MNEYKFPVRNRIITCYLMLSALLLISPTSCYATCRLLQGSTFQVDVGRSLTGGLSVPADTPNGTIIFEETGPFIPEYRISCDTSFTAGFVVNPSLGSVNSGASVYPLGNGLAFRIGVMENGAVPFQVAPRRLAAGTWYWGKGQTLFQILKVGTLSATTRVAAGSLGYSLADSSFIPFKLNLSNEIHINAASCQSPSTLVAMGNDYHLMDFRTNFSCAKQIHFHLSLNNCQSGINKISYSIQPNSKIIDKGAGVLSLSPDSTARGIGIKLLNDKDQPVIMEQQYDFSEFNKTDKSFNIPLSACYTRLPLTELKAGTANADVTFQINYN